MKELEKIDEDLQDKLNEDGDVTSIDTDIEESAEHLSEESAEHLSEEASTPIITPEMRFKDNKPGFISKTRAKIYLVYQVFLDVFRKPTPTSKPKRTRERVSISVEKERLYRQFVNKLIILLLNGVATGALLLAAFDYIATAQIPERNPVVLLFFFVLSVLNLVYWWNTYKKSEGIEGLKSVAHIALIIAIIGTTTGVYDLHTNYTNRSTLFYGEKMAIKDKKDTAVLLASYIDTWRHTPNYSIVQVAEDVHYAVVYNSEGESVAQLIMPEVEEEEPKTESINNVVIALKDGTAVVVTEDKIERRLEVDNLKYVELALQWVAKGKADITRHSPTLNAVKKTEAPLDGLPGTEYIVKIEGISSIKEFYATALGSAAAHEMFATIEALGENITLSYQIALDNSYIGAASFIDIDGEESLLWLIDNYVAAYDWTLGVDDWYKYDYRDAEKNEKMVETALYNASTMMERLGEALGIDNK